MSYTLAQVTNELIHLLKSEPAAKVQWRPRKKDFQIKWKEGVKYLSGQECFNRMVALYESAYPNKVNWSFYIYEAKDNYVTIRSLHDIL